MLGVVLRVREDGIWLVSNDEPYHQKVKFLSNRKITDRPWLCVGTKVGWDGKRLMLVEFLNCERCHRVQASILRGECDCEPRDIISASGVYQGSEVLNNRIYFTIKWGHRLLYVTFCPAINRIMNYYTPGDFIEFKGVFLDSSRDYDVIRIFYVKF